MTDYLSVAEVAAELSVSKETVRRAILAGRLPAYKFGTHRQGTVDKRDLSVSRDELAAFVEGCRLRPSSPLKGSAAGRPSGLIESARRMAARGIR